MKQQGKTKIQNPLVVGMVLLGSAVGAWLSAQNPPLPPCGDEYIEFGTWHCVLEGLPRCTSPPWLACKKAGRFIDEQPSYCHGTRCCDWFDSEAGFLCCQFPTAWRVCLDENGREKCRVCTIWRTADVYRGICWDNRCVAIGSPP